LSTKRYISGALFLVFLGLASATADPESPRTKYCEQAPGKGLVYGDDEFFSKCIAWCLGTGHELAPGEGSDRRDSCTRDCCPMPAIILE